MSFQLNPTAYGSQPAGAQKIELPVDVVSKLGSVGVNGNALLHVRADLDERGQWGRRFLVATTERVVVVSTHGAGDDRARAGVANSVSIDLDVPLRSVIDPVARGLVGATALEARLLGEPRQATGERVVELLRSSSVHARDLNRAARQLKHLREHGRLAEEYETDELGKRQACPACDRSLAEESKICPFCGNKWQAMRRLLGYLKPYKWIAIANAILSVLAVGLSFVPQYAFAELIDHVFAPRGRDLESMHVAADFRCLSFWICIIVIGQIVSAGASALRGRWISCLGAQVLHDLRGQLYEQLQLLSLSFFDKREVGAIMGRVQNDIGMVQSFLLEGSENLVVSILTIIGVVALMLARSWQLALYVLIPVPFVVIATNRYWRDLMKLWRRVMHHNSTLSARLADNLNGVRVVRAFAQEARETERFLGKSGELRDATINVETRAAIFYPALGLVMGLGAPITWFVGGREVLTGALTLGGLTFFTGLLARLYEPIQMLTRMVNFTTRAMTATERVFELIDIEPEIKQRPDAVAMPHIKGTIEFRNVTFGYDPHRPVLHNIDLRVKQGEMIGLVGHSGAGKSTLINLLMRFYDTNDGLLLVDGVDIRAIVRDDLRGQIGIVLQEPYLFHGSIYENIAYAKPNARPEEIIAAAKAAYAHNFIVEFADGYDTLVGERGTRLSGGERQRISIARAILHDPRILILDEATASVDTQTEQQIQNALRNLISGRTTFAVAHRLSTLRHADRLIVLEGGRIAEQGSHDELLAARGAFYNLVNAQKSLNEVTAVGG